MSVWTPKPEPTAAEATALDRFAAVEGRKWKRLLTEVYWYNARIWIDTDGTNTTGTTLHSLRNRGGHAIVDAYKPRKVPA